MTAYVRGALRVFDLSFGRMLWSRRTLFLAVVLAAPICLAVIGRLAAAGGAAHLRINGVEVGGTAIFGMIAWLLFVRLIVPLLGVFYGTSLIADEVEEKTLTYLFTRPVPRGAVLLGKYAAYLAFASLIVLPSLVLTYAVLVPRAEIGATLPGLLADLGILALGLAAYGALFAWAGAVTRRPLVMGLVVVFGWEPVALVMPGYLRHFTVAYYLQALVPHAAPSGGPLALLEALVRDSPGVPASVLWLAVVTGASLWLAVRAVERREYVLDQ